MFNKTDLLTAKPSIRTYIRLNAELIELLKANIVTSIVIEGKWLQLGMCHDTYLDQRIMTWLEAQSPSAYYRGADDRIMIGVSLSQLDFSQLEYLGRSKIIRVISPINRNYANAVANPSQPLLAVVPNSGIFYLETKAFDKKMEELAAARKSSDQLNATELAFMESLNGHDFWYGYSDSISVYRAGEVRAKDLLDAGVESGLTLARAKELYTKKYKELTPK